MFGSGEKDRSLLKLIQDSQRNIAEIDVKIKSDIQSLRSLSGCDDDGVIRQAIRDIKLKQTKQQEYIDQLKVLSKKVRDAGERVELNSQIDKHVGETAFNNQHLRQAVTVAIQTYETEKRDNLFSRKSDDNVSYRRKKKGDAMGQETAEANTKLSELVALMNEQVDASGSTLDKLLSSSSVIGETETEFHTMSSTIQVSNKLLSKYNRRELTDKILFALTVCFFFGTVLYIVRKRAGNLLWFI